MAALLRQRALIATMIVLSLLSILLGISIAFSAFIFPQSGAYVQQYEIDRMMNIAGDYPLSIKEARFKKDLGWFSGSPRKIRSIDDTVLAALAFFDDLGYVSGYSIPRRKLMSFLLHVRDGYKDVPYHNWVHGFSSAHFAYLLINELDLNKLLGESNAMAYLIAALTHDVGHLGTNAHFQILSKSQLSTLFEQPSLLEKYHVSLMKKILDIQENNIFENVDPEQKDKVVNTIESVIMATDLHENLQNFNNTIRSLISTGFDANDDRNVSLLLNVLATAFDLSDQTKDFDSLRESASLLSKEFYDQGQRELKMRHQPEEWMNPNTANVISDQRKFIAEIAKPLYENLHDLFPESQGLSYVFNATKRNLNYWNAFQKAFNMKGGKSKGVPLSVLQNEDIVKIAGEVFDFEYENKTAS